MKPSTRGPAARLGLLLVAILFGDGCLGDPPAGPAAFLANLEQTSTRAAQAQARGDLPAAERALEALLADPECGGLVAADCRWVRQDLFGRLGWLKLRRGAAVEASSLADQGLALGDASDVPAAELHLLRGQALEGQGRDGEAARAYHRALEINARLLQELLPAGGAEGGHAPNP